jgi:hypothetical protein
MWVIFLFPARFCGRKLQEITRESYDLNAAMNSLMVERFNVAVPNSRSSSAGRTKTKHSKRKPVPPKYSDRSAIIEVDQLSPAPVVGPPTTAYRDGRSLFVLSSSPY